MTGGCIIYAIRLLRKKDTQYWGTVLDLLEYYRTKGKDKNFDLFYLKVQREEIEWEDVRSNLFKLKLKEPPVKIICPRPLMSPQSQG